MNLLLDTHAFLWFIDNDPRLSSYSTSLIEDDANSTWLSMASVWEMAIKINLGKLKPLDPSIPFETAIRSQLSINGFHLLSVDISHTARTIGLPMHHRDPFDRLLVAQALQESMAIVSMDTVLDGYGVQRLW